MMMMEAFLLENAKGRHSTRSAESSESVGDDAASSVVVLYSERKHVEGRSR